MSNKVKNDTIANNNEEYKENEYLSEEERELEKDLEKLQNFANMKDKVTKFGSNILKIFSTEGEVKSFNGQVAGHGGIIQLPNGSLIKGTNETELNFYKTVHYSNLPIKKYMPKCFNFDPSFEEIKKKYISNGKKENEAKKENFINMENLLLPYKHPNVIDIKLGTRLYDDKADEYKKQKMISMAGISTASETGLLISAVQVYDRQRKVTKKVTKNYGMFLKPRYLNQAIIRFFCNIVEPLYGNDEYQKEHELSDEFFKSEPSDYVVGFLKEILIKIKELKNAVSQSHVVIYGSSICIIYETIDIAKEVEKRCKNPDAYNYPFSFHYIDFAHASFVDPTSGDDESLMTGFNNFIKVIEDYLKTYNKL